MWPESFTPESFTQGAVLAHGASAGVPLPLLLLGAVAAVAGVGALLGRRGTPEPPRARPLDLQREASITLPLVLTKILDHPVMRLALGLAGTVAAGAVLVVALARPPGSGGMSLALRVVLFDLWTALVLASLLLGPVWVLVSPLRSLAAGLARLSRDPAEQGTRPLPERLGWWPAAVGLLVFAWVRLALPGRPLALVLLLAGYVLVELGAVTRYGQRWLVRGDPLEAYSRLLGAMAPLRRNPDGRLRLQSPRRHLATTSNAPGLPALAAVAIAGDLIDAVEGTQAWHSLALNRGPAALVLTVGLVAGAVVIGLAATVATRRAGLGIALLPVVAGWAAGHQLGALWPVLGLAGFVAGHLGALFVAHDRAVVRYGPKAGAAQLELRALVLALLVVGLVLRFGGV
ncbi:MAG: hypothetical protein ACRDYX_13525 [Egibacteraceae bacterium]